MSPLTAIGLSEPENKGLRKIFNIKRRVPFSCEYNILPHSICEAVIQCGGEVSARTCPNAEESADIRQHETETPIRLRTHSARTSRKDSAAVGRTESCGGQTITAAKTSTKAGAAAGAATWAETTKRAAEHRPITQQHFTESHNRNEKPQWGESPADGKQSASTSEAFPGLDPRRKTPSVTKPGQIQSLVSPKTAGNA